jgi:SAM-dependent methyltransferase
MSEVFDVYARYYDLLYRDKDYATETAYIIAQLRKYCPSGTRILELGCGTGIHAEFLARQGFDVHGTDQSAEMLAKAEARRATLPADVGARLRFSQGDARSIRTSEKYDVAISLFHVMSYHNSNAELKAAFATAAAHLGTGGVFLFDYWYGPAVLQQKPETREKHLADDVIDVQRIAEPLMRLAENIVDVNYTVTIKPKATNEIHHVKETHSMRYLFLPEISLLAGDMDWEVCANKAWMKDTPPAAEDWTGFSVMRRK